MPATPACAKCRSTDLVRIDLSAGAARLRFEACRNCEHRWWTKMAEQVTVELPEVLESVGAAAGR